MKWTDEFKLSDSSVNTVNEMFQEFQTVLESAMNSHIPTKIISKRNQTPWISRRIKRLHKRKQRAFDSYKQHRDLARYETFSKQRKITYTENRNAHRSYISSICSDSPKRFWSYIKSLKVDNIGIPTLNNNNKLESDNRLKAEILKGALYRIQILCRRYTFWSGLVTEEELETCLRVLHDNKAPGCDGIPIEAYRGSPAAKRELFAIVRLMWKTEVIPPALVRGTFVMLYKKGPRDNFGNYRAIGLMCHSYKLLSMLVLHRMRDAVESRLAETQAGFRRERGCRDNVLLLRLLMDAVLRAGKQAVVTFIDYRAAFDTISHRFLDESLAAAGVQPKIRRIVKAIYAEATGMVRLRLPSGETLCSEPFPVDRGVIQGDIFSPQCFTLGLDRIFRLHDIAGQGIGGPSLGDVTATKLEYADDVGLLDWTATEASERVSALASGSRTSASMEMSVPKSKGMHVHVRERLPVSTEVEVKALVLPHSCPECERTFPTSRGLAVHRARWCRPGQRPASRRGQLADKAVKLVKRQASAALLQPVVMEGESLETVYQFDYLGCRFTSDGDDAADMRHRMAIAGERSRRLDYLWHDNRLPRSLKLRLYAASVCSTLTHGSEAWILTPRALATLNGFNSRQLHRITGRSYREEATTPSYDLLTAVRTRRHQWLGHILRMPANRLVRRAVLALGQRAGPPYQPGSILMDAPFPLDELVLRAADRRGWARDTRSLSSLQESP